MREPVMGRSRGAFVHNERVTIRDRLGESGVCIAFLVVAGLQKPDLPDSLPGLRSFTFAFCPFDQFSLQLLF